MSENQPVPSTEASNRINFSDIVNPEYGQIRIIYGVHNKQEVPSSLSQGTQALFLEVMGYKHDPADAVNHRLGRAEEIPNPLFENLAKLTDPKQYLQIGEYAARENIPVYLPDTMLDLKILVGETYGLPIAELAAGAYFLNNVRANTNRNMTRRRFIQTALKLGFGAWLSMPATTTAARILSVNTETGEELTKHLKQVDHTLHPEERYLTIAVRNTLIAEKQSYIMRRNNLAKTDLVIGADHVVEYPFKSSSEERITFLKTVRKLGLIRFFDKDELTVPELRYNGTKWVQTDAIEVPTLRDLFKTV
jgi:hypothetical protein